MIPFRNSDTEKGRLDFDRARLQRLARYRALQRSFACDRRIAVARGRLLRLHGDIAWGWLPL